MNYEHVKSFIKVVESGSFSAAAASRFLSQPTISNQVKALEKELGTQLLIRHANTVELTKQGELFYTYARMMADAESEAIRSIQDDADNDYHLIRIAAPGLQTDQQLNSFFVRMLKEGDEKVLYSIIQRDDTAIPGIIASGEMALGICNVTSQNPELEFEHAFTEEIVLITPNQPKYRDLKPDELRTLLLTEGHIRYDFGEGPDFLWNDFFGKTIGIDLHNIKANGYCSNYHIILEAVEAGLGIAFMSNTIMQKPWREGRILAYRCEGLLQKKFYVVYNRNRMNNSKRLRHAKDALVEELGASITNPELSF